MARPRLDTKYHISARIRRVLTCKKYNRCNLPICRICARRKAEPHKEKLERILTTTDSFDKYFPGKIRLYRVVLTLRHSSLSLREQVSRLYTSFRKLTWARSPFRKEHLYGGVYRLHVGWTKRSRWHPHLDCIFEARSSMYHTIGWAWADITKDSPVVKVQAVRRTPASFRRLPDYILKVPFVDVEVKDEATAMTNGPLLDEYETATRNRRKIDYLGTWRRRRRSKQ